MTHEIAGGGILLGSELPLNLPDTALCHNIYKGQVEQWAATNAPHLRVISLEAYELLTLEKFRV